MPCGAILTFDQQTDAWLRGMWQAIEDAGLPSVFLEQNYPPHVTLLACEDLDLEGLLEHDLDGYLASHPPLNIDFHGFGIFTGSPPVIYLGVTRSPALSALHAAFWEAVESYATQPHPLYRPEAWVPHVTLDLAADPAQAGAVLQALLETPRPVHGQLRYLELIKLEDGVNSLYSGLLGGHQPPGEGRLTPPPARLPGQEE